MRKTAIVATAVLAILAAAVLVWGFSLPREARASRTAVIAAPVERVFALVTDVGAQADWRSDVALVTVGEAGTTWSETTREGITIAFETVEKVPAERFVIRFSSSRGFSGVWEGTFTPEGGGTRVAFTEAVTTPGVVGRILARLLAPPGAHIDRYLEDLASAAEDADAEVVGREGA